MSVTIAVPGIPVGESFSTGNPNTQDGGMISPGVSVLRLDCGFAGGDVGADFHLDDYGLSYAFFWGLDWTVFGYYSFEDAGSVLYNPPYWHQIYYNPTTNVLSVRFIDGPTGQFQVWAVGQRKPRHD